MKTANGGEITGYLRPTALDCTLAQPQLFSDGMTHGIGRFSRSNIFPTATIEKCFKCLLPISATEAIGGGEGGNGDCGATTSFGFMSFLEDFVGDRRLLAHLAARFGPLTTTQW